MGRPRSPRPLILDAGALVAFEGRDRRVSVLVQRAKDLASPLIVPSTVLAQVWRDGSRQARLAGLLSHRDLRVIDFTEALARATGELCGSRQVADIVDASVVLIARQHHGVVLTGDAVDLLRLDPALEVVTI
jgi:hypothetical protein